MDNQIIIHIHKLNGEIIYSGEAYQNVGEHTNFIHNIIYSNVLTYNYKIMSLKDNRHVTCCKLHLSDNNESFNIIIIIHSPYYMKYDKNDYHEYQFDCTTPNHTTCCYNCLSEILFFGPYLTDNGSRCYTIHWSLQSFFYYKAVCIKCMNKINYTNYTLTVNKLCCLREINDLEYQEENNILITDIVDKLLELYNDDSKLLMQKNIYRIDKPLFQFDQTVLDRSKYLKYLFPFFIDVIPNKISILDKIKLNEFENFKYNENDIRLLLKYKHKSDDLWIGPFTYRHVSFGSNSSGGKIDEFYCTSYDKKKFLNY